MTKYRLEGLDCANCAAKIERELRKHKRFELATVNFIDQTLAIEADAGAEELARSIVAELEPSVEMLPASVSQAEVEAAGDPWPIARILASAVLLAVGLVFGKTLRSSPGAWTEWAVLLAAYLIVGWEVLAAAFKDIGRGRIFNEMFLMAVATLGALALGELPEAVGVMLFYSVGEYLQGRAVDSSRRTIAGLTALRPEFARLVSGPRPGIVEPEAVKVGEIVEVRAGERIPLDGELVEGESFVDTSSLTGEPVPREVGPGDGVMAGFVNDGGVLRIRATAPFGASQAARILELVQGAASRKAPTEKFITRFAEVYTPFVVGAAALLAVLPPLLVPGARFAEWLHRALVLLVISCPCALVISVPLGYFGGLGSAARHKVLFKGSDHLDSLLKARTFVFDKTGTLTEGNFRVAAVEPGPGFDSASLLGLAAAAESRSPHPVAKAIRRAAEEGWCEGAAAADAAAASGRAAGGLIGEVEARERRGLGVSASVGGRRVLVGKPALLAEAGLALPAGAGASERRGAGGSVAAGGPASSAGGLSAATEVLVAVDGAYAGRILVADRIRPEAAEALAGLKAAGVRRFVMLTGDNAAAAEAAARELGIGEVRAGLLPEDKVAAVEELEAGLAPGEKLVFVGDGMNDAPVLTRADLGVAMGGLGSDAAIEAADAVVMDDRLVRLPAAMAVAAFTRRIVVQNIVFSLGVKGVFLLLGAAGGATMWEAVIADVGVALAAVLNSVRAVRFRGA